MSEDTVTCACCGEPRSAGNIARLHCRPDVAVCGGCAHYLVGQLERPPTVIPIFPVQDMAAATRFWTGAGLQVEPYDAGYAFVRHRGSEVAHLILQDDLDPERNPAACYVHVHDPAAWHDRWKAGGLPVSDVVREPWGMIEFSVRDPSGNLVRVGCEAD